ncbi:L-serine dehydratase, beta chain [compost metagenome]
MSKYKSVFDIIGPIMVGPSSSHTAGAVRIGRFARTILGGTPRHATILLHGSFLETGPGHGTDKGIVAGLLGMETYDPQVKESFEAAAREGMTFEVGEVNLGPKVHPCSAKLILEAPDGRKIDVIGTSIGGGNVAITEVDGYQVRLSGEYPTVITVHEDKPGVIGKVTGILAEQGVNVAFMNVARKQKGRDAFMTIEGDHDVPQEAIAAIAAVDGIRLTRYLPKLT